MALHRWCSPASPDFLFPLPVDLFIPLGALCQDGTGTVTAGNSSPLTDGAAALVLSSRAKARELGLPVLAVVRSYADANQAPEWWACTLAVCCARFGLCHAVCAVDLLARAGSVRSNADANLAPEWWVCTRGCPCCRPVCAVYKGGPVNSCPVPWSPSPCL